MDKVRIVKPNLLYSLGAVVLLVLMSPLIIIAGACEGIYNFYSMFFNIYFRPPMMYGGKRG